MKLFQINDTTKLPEPVPELLVIPEFKELMRRLKKIDGDADGRKKLQNEKELAYVYYMCTYDSRFKLLQGKERIDAVKKLLSLPDDWVEDELIKKCLKIYEDSQTTESTAVVESLSEAIMNLTKFIKTAQMQLASLSVGDAKTANEFLNVLDRIPKTIESLKQAKAQLDREHDALAKGKKGRVPNKFEI